MKEHFCILSDTEKKAYDYTKMYYDHLMSDDNPAEYSSIGTRIQGLEIKKHLKEMGINKGTKEAIDETNRWIDVYNDNGNGYKFRIYLNTIKLIADAYYLTGMELNYDNFLNTLKKANEKKDYNESIF